MRKAITFTILLVMLMAIPFSIKAQEATKTKIFYGLNFESNAGFMSGAVLNLPGNFKTYPYVRFSLDTGSYANGLQTDKSVGLEVGYTVKETPKFSFSLLAGSSVDWTAPSSGVNNWTTYLPQAAGFLCTFSLPTKTPLLGWVLPEPFGVALWLKFKPQIFDSNTLWPNKGSAGFAFYGSV